MTMLLRGPIRAYVGMLRRMNTAETATCRRSGGPTVTDNHATYLEPVLTRLKLRVIIASPAAGDQP